MKKESGKKGNSIYNIKDFVEAPNEKILKYNNMKQWDVILANPPFNLGEKMLTKWFDLADTICTVQPSTWLLGKKKTKSICSHLDSGEFTADIESINGNEFFDTGGIGGVIAVQFFEKNITKYNTCNIVFDGKQYTKTDDISLTSNDELLQSVKLKIKNKLNDSLQNHLKKNTVTTNYVSVPLIKNPNPEWYIYRQMVFSGQSNARSKQIGEFWALISRSLTYDKTCGKYKDLIKKTIVSTATHQEKKWLEYYFAFDTEIELKNFWNFIHTDFVNIILFFYKTGLQIHSGVQTEIPWQDFTQEWNDEKLFKKYGITKEEIQDIYEILPNYYGIERINLDTYEL